MNKQNKFYLLVFITLSLGVLAAYLAYLIYAQSQSVTKITDQVEQADQPVLTSQNPQDEELPEIEIVDAGINFIRLITDKDIYISYENIEMTLNLEVDNEIKNAEIRITGIKPYRVAYLREAEIVDLKKGKNSIVINAQAPSCTSGCGGVYPGPYDIEAEVFVEGGLAGQALTTITLAE